jgi:hypothetical protein
MRTNLIPLLRDRRVCHPSRIVSAAITKPRELQIRVSGHPWWKDGADHTRDHDITLIFRGLGEGILDLFDFKFEDNEALDYFSVEEAVNVPWARADGHQIYCSAPLPRPMDVYVLVHDFLVSHGAFMRAEQFLNCGNTELLGNFFEITKSDSYLVATAPPAIGSLICRELDTQGVRHNEIPARVAQPGLLLVQIIASRFFCEIAEAEFEE